MQPLRTRCWDAFRVLMRDPFSAVTARQLAGELGVSERTARYDLDELSRWLGEQGVELRRVPRRGAFVDPDCVGAALGILREAEEDESARPLYLSGPQRTRAMVALLLSDACPATLAELADSYGVSRTTASRDFHRARAWLSERGAAARWLPAGGWTLEVGERRRRQLMLAFLEESLSTRSGLVMGEVCEPTPRTMGAGLLIDLSDLEGCASALEAFCAEREVSLTDRSFVTLCHYLCIVRRRASGHAISLPPDKGDSPSRDLVQSARALLEAVGVDSEESSAGEAHELAALLDALSRLRPEAGVAFSSVAARVTSLVVSDVSSDLGADLFLDRELIDGLRVHIHAMLARQRLGIPARNPLLDEIRVRFPELFESCARSMWRALGDLDVKVSDDEVGFVVMYVGASLERLGGIPVLERALRVAIVCGAGMGTVTFLSRSLAREFPRLRIVARLSAQESLRHSYDDVDLILTTVSLPCSFPRPILRVSPLLSRSDVRRIASFLRSPEEAAAEAEVSEVLSLVEGTCTVRDRSTLMRGLRIIMRGGPPSPVAPGLPGLGDLVDERYVRLGLRAGSWDEAVRATSAPLLESSLMTEAYLRRMLEFGARFEQFGVILAPLCAPHAEPDADNRPAIAVSTLSHGVEVTMDGQKVRLSVFMVLCLQTPIAHSVALDQLFTLVDERPDFIARLGAARTPSELVGTIRRLCSER